MGWTGGNVKYMGYKNQDKDTGFLNKGVEKILTTLLPFTIFPLPL
jgi:hypothetical protein